MIVLKTLKLKILLLSLVASLLFIGRANCDDIPEDPQVITWQPIESASAYLVQVALDKDFKEIVQEVRVTQANFSIGDIDVGEYFLRIAGVDAFGKTGEYSKTATLTILTQPIKLLQPADRYTADFEKLTTDVAFRWDDVEGPESYELQISRDENFRDVTTYPVEESEKIVSLKTDGKPYFWRVIGKFPNGSSSYSTTKRSLTLRYFTTAPTLVKPADKSNIETSASKNSDVQFKWNAVEGSGQYEFELALEKIDGPKIPVMQESVTSRRAILSPGNYVWRVRAVDSTGRVGPWSATWSLAIDGVLSPPVILQPENGSTEISKTNKFPTTFRWSGPIEETVFELQISNDKDFSKIIKRYRGRKRAVKTYLKEGTFYARMRAKSKGYKTSEWSSTKKFYNKVESPWRRKLDFYLSYDYGFENMSSATNHLSGTIGLSHPLGIDFEAQYKFVDRFALSALYNHTSYSVDGFFLTQNETQKNLTVTDSDLGIKAHYYIIPQNLKSDFGLSVFVGHYWLQRNAYISDIDLIDPEVDFPIFENKAQKYQTISVGSSMQWTRTLNSEIRASLEGHYRYKEAPFKTSNVLAIDALGGYHSRFTPQFYYGVDAYVRYFSSTYAADEIQGKSSHLTMGVKLGIGFGL